MTGQIKEEMKIEKRTRPQKKVIIRDESVRPAEYEDAISIMLERKNYYGQMPIEDDFSPEEAQRIIRGLGQSTFAEAVIETLREVRRRKGQVVYIAQSPGEFAYDALPPKKGTVIESYNRSIGGHSVALR